MKRYTFENQDYYWSGSCWLDQHFIAVPGCVAERLCETFSPQLRGVVSAAKVRRTAKETGQAALRTLASRSLQQQQTPSSLAVRVGLLRDQGLPLKGLQISHRGPFSSALLLARAACWCDLGRWKQARRAAKMALEMGAGVKALNVLARVERETHSTPHRRGR